MKPPFNHKTITTGKGPSMPSLQEILDLDKLVKKMLARSNRMNKMLKQIIAHQNIDNHDN